MNLGIDKNNNFFYEGKADWGYAVWPSPIVTPAKIVTESEGRLRAEDRKTLVADGMVFREDSFDPVTRVRRGRFYRASDHQPLEWYVQAHPAIPNEAFRADKGIIKKSLDTFYRHTIWYQFSTAQKKQPLVLLGFKDRFTIWNVIDIESISTGEDLVTLKSCSSLGILPVVESSEIPGSSRKAVMASLQIFVDEVHRAAPASVIDRARRLCKPGTVGILWFRRKRCEGFERFDENSRE